jgi:hypothetical protein
MPGLDPGIHRDNAAGESPPFLFARISFFDGEPGAFVLARYHFTVGKPRRRCDQTSILRGRNRR